jgi:hypothetical protein
MLTRCIPTDRRPPRQPACHLRRRRAAQLRPPPCALDRGRRPARARQVRPAPARRTASRGPAPSARPPLRGQRARARDADLSARTPPLAAGVSDVRKLPVRTERFAPVPAHACERAHAPARRVRPAAVVHVPVARRRWNVRPHARQQGPRGTHGRASVCIARRRPAPAPLMPHGPSLGLCLNGVGYSDPAVAAPSLLHLLFSFARGLAHCFVSPTISLDSYLYHGHCCTCIWLSRGPLRLPRDNLSRAHPHLHTVSRTKSSSGTCPVGRKVLWRGVLEPVEGVRCSLCQTDGMDVH